VKSIKNCFLFTRKPCRDAKLRGLKVTLR
jgi:hypothetical protein